MNEPIARETPTTTHQPASGSPWFAELGSLNWPRIRLVVRLLTAAALVTALVVIAVSTLDAVPVTESVRATRPTTGTGTITSTEVIEPSAVQVIQVYAEGAFLALVAIGLAVAVHIGAREPSA